MCGIVVFEQTQKVLQRGGMSVYKFSLGLQKAVGNSKTVMITDIVRSP